MPKIKIEFLIAIENYILMVYYSPRHCYKFSILDGRGHGAGGNLQPVRCPFGIVYQLDEIFYTAKAALTEGKTAITAML
ncbi:MAG: hypothetical protein RLZZ574_985 [Cyanobacteriota bacterium]